MFSKRIKALLERQFGAREQLESSSRETGSSEESLSQIEEDSERKGRNRRRRSRRSKRKRDANDNRLMRRKRKRTVGFERHYNCNASVLRTLTKATITKNARRRERCNGRGDKLFVEGQDTQCIMGSDF